MAGLAAATSKFALLKSAGKVSVGMSFNGRKADFESANRGSSPRAPTNFLFGCLSTVGRPALNRLMYVRVVPPEPIYFVS